MSATASWVRIPRPPLRDQRIRNTRTQAPRGASVRVSSSESGDLRVPVSYSCPSDPAGGLRARPRFSGGRHRGRHRMHGLGAHRLPSAGLPPARRHNGCTRRCLVRIHVGERPHAPVERIRCVASWACIAPLVRERPQVGRASVEGPDRGVSRRVGHGNRRAKSVIRVRIAEETRGNPRTVWHPGPGLRKMSPWLP